eukprot:424080_1
MTQLQWPIIVNGKEFSKPCMKEENKIHVNNEDILNVFQSNPKFFCYLQENINKLDDTTAFIQNMFEPFESEITKLSLGRIKVPTTEWQEAEEHKYVLINGFECENYNDCILPFMDDVNQYKCFFINIGETIREQNVVLYFQSDNAPDESHEDYVITSKDNIQIIYDALPNDDENIQKLGMKDLCIFYLKYLVNDRLDEIQLSCEDVMRIYFLRLRGKNRNGHYGQICSVQGIISNSQWDIMESKIEDIVEEDVDFDKNDAIISYRLSRQQLFGALQIHPMFLMRVFDQFGKEMKIKRSLSDEPLYDSNAEGFTSNKNNLLLKIQEKYKKKKKIVSSLYAFNGLRVTFNGNRRLLKLTTNSFNETVSKIDLSKNRVRIAQVLGRKRKW